MGPQQSWTQSPGWASTTQETGAQRGPTGAERSSKGSRARARLHRLAQRVTARGRAHPSGPPQLGSGYFQDGQQPLPLPRVPLQPTGGPSEPPHQAPRRPPFLAPAGVQTHRPHASPPNSGKRTRAQGPGPTASGPQSPRAAEGLHKMPEPGAAGVAHQEKKARRPGLRRKRVDGTHPHPQHRLSWVSAQPQAPPGLKGSTPRPSSQDASGHTSSKSHGDTQRQPARASPHTPLPSSNPDTYQGQGARGTSLCPPL